MLDRAGKAGEAVSVEERFPSEERVEAPEEQVEAPEDDIPF